MPRPGIASSATEHAPHNAMIDPGEIACFHDRCSDLMRELLTALAAAPDEPRTFPQIEEAIGWPRRRIASVLGGVSQLRHTEFGGRRPYRFHDDRQAASGRWELWMDGVQAAAVRDAAGLSPGLHPHDLVVRVIDASDVGPIASLRSLSSPEAEDDPDFATRIAAWLLHESDRRTTWLASLHASPVGMASMLEYRRMPRPGHADSHWGYVGNMFVREDVRNRGIGSALLRAIIAAADERCYARLVLSPSARALPFFRRAGFRVADGTAGDHRLLVRPARAA